MTAPSGWVDPNPQNSPDPGVNRALAFAGVVLVGVVIVSLIGVVLLKNGAATDDTDRPLLALSAINAPATDGFMESQVVAPTQISEAAADQIATFSAQLPVNAHRGVRVVPGTLPGLYGVAGQGPSCDVPGVANQLDADHAKEGVWAGALGLTARQVPSYLNSLTPVDLTADTWVTAYSYVNGGHVGLQQVLQAGTAVLVDTAGVPRLHCASGDPLGPPADLDIAVMRTDGKHWSGFDPRNVVAIAYGGASSVPATVAEFVLLDLSNGQQIKRKPGGVIDLARAGDDQVQLPDPAAMNVAPNLAGK